MKPMEMTNGIIHNFIVDDLKLYASHINITATTAITTTTIDLQTTFFKDTRMTFREGKCAYQQVENGKLIKNSENLKMNNLNIKPIKDGDTCKYLCIDKNISYVGNKEYVGIKRE